MADLVLEVEASDGLLPSFPKIGVDGVPVEKDANGEWKTTATGSCGDGSWHKLYYDFRGPEGKKLKVTIYCGGAKIHVYQGEIYPGYTRNSGYAEFKL